MRFFRLLPALAVCLLLSCTGLSAKATTGYYPLQITNLPAKSKNVTHTYILLMGQDWTKAANNCVLQLTYNNTRNAMVASLVPVTSTTDSRQYSYPIDSLPGYDTTTNSITIYIPHLQSGRCMISLNYKLYMPPVQGGGSWSLQEPSISNVSDVNYDIIYDKFEYSYDTTGTEGNLYINPTAVDFFSIPVHLQCGKQASGASTTKSRDQLVKTMQQTFTTLDKSSNSTWSTLLITDPKTSTILRVAAPNLTTAFDSFYLAPKTPGFNYIDSVTKYYQSNTAVINCAELNTPGSEVYDFYDSIGEPVTPAQDPGAYLFTGKVHANNWWVFTNNPLKTTGPAMSDSLDMNTVTTENFFGPGTAPFATPNKTVQSVLVKNITAAFTVNLLPAPNGMTLDSSYLQGKSYPHFKTNKNLKAPANSGPWYDLYSQAIHNAIPVIYAFAYDDVLGQDGTLVSSDTTQPVIITLGNMGNIVIPKHQGALPVNAVTLTYNSGFQLVVSGNDSNYVDTLKWTVPVAQPANAKYFFLLNGKGAGYSINNDSLVNYQVSALNGNRLYNSTETTGVLRLPVSLLSSPAPGGIYMQVFTCGGPNCHCDYPTLSDTVLCAVGSLPLAPPGPPVQNVLPVTIKTNSGFVQSGNNYSVTVTWSVPAGQPSNANYFLMLNGQGGDKLNFIPDSIMAHQVGNFAAYNDTTMTLTIPTSLLSTTNPGGVYMQVFTCGGPGCPCVTSANLSAWTCAPGSAPAAPTVSSRKKKKR